MPSAQYRLSTVTRDGGSVTVTTVGYVLTLCRMIDLHGHVTDKDYEAISNGRSSLGYQHCSIMMSPHSTRHDCARTATRGKCIGRLCKHTLTQSVIIYHGGVFVVCIPMRIELPSAKAQTMMCKTDAVHQ